MIKITYEFFKFKEPRLLTKDEFLKAKEVLLQFPNSDIMPSFSFYEEKKPIMNILLIGIIPAIILIIFGESSISNGALKVIMVISSLYVAMCVIASMIFVLPEYFNFVRTKSKMRVFFRKLQSDIILSSNYDEFLRRQKGTL